MQPLDNGQNDSSSPSSNSPISTPPMAASSALKVQKTRLSSIEGTPLTQAHSDVSLPIRDRKMHASAASLYASTLSPPGSRSQSPAGRPSSRLTSGSVFGANTNNALALIEGAGDSPGDPLNLVMKAFVPHVAIHSSDDTEQLLKEKGFELGLWELLRPFGDRVLGKVSIRDSSGFSRTYEDFSIRFTRHGEGIEHPEPSASGRKTAQPSSKANGVAEKAESGTQSFVRRGGDLEDIEAVVDRHLVYAEESDFGSVRSPVTTKQGLDVDTPSSYYSLYLRRILSGLSVVPHETFSHPVAGVIAISSRNPAPIETLRRLYNESSTGEKRWPNWVDPQYLRYYVLVHDEEKDDITKSMSLFDQMKRSFGLHCHLLRIRGTQSAATDDDSIHLPTNEWISASEELAHIRMHEHQDDLGDLTRYIFESDATAIRTFVREMVTQSIIPTMERHMSVWNNEVASKRRGMAGRFLGLTRRWGFGSNSKSTSTNQATGSNYDSLGFYGHDAPEAIMRKLADYAFMLRDWKLAYSTYDLVRGDFSNDKAWKYYAAANEMAAISLLIMPQNLSAKTRAESLDAMFEASFYSYLTRCTAPFGAIRCLILGLELLRIRGGSSIDDAAKWGLRLLESKTLGLVGDALIKERLAVCYASKSGLGVQGLGARRRKSALWSILGSEAWLAQSKFLQAQRCLNEARKMYSDLPAPNGIDQFEQASSFMLGLGQRLNEQLESDESQSGAADDVDEQVDEESEIMNTRGRRISTAGFPRAAAAILDTTPLDNPDADDFEENVNTQQPNPEFG